MRQVHIAGEKLFVDYADDTVPIVDATTGEITRVAEAGLEPVVQQLDQFDPDFVGRNGRLSVWHTGKC